jgi:hypothetical protein
MAARELLLVTERERDIADQVVVADRVRLGEVHLPAGAFFLSQDCEDMPDEEPAAGVVRLELGEMPLEVGAREVTVAVQFGEQRAALSPGASSSPDLCMNLWTV